MLLPAVIFLRLCNSLGEAVLKKKDLLKVKATFGFPNVDYSGGDHQQGNCSILLVIAWNVLSIPRESGNITEEKWIGII